MKVYIGDVKKRAGRKSHEEIEENISFLHLYQEKILFADKIRASLDITNCDTEIIIEGKINTLLILTCSRCLEPFVYNLSANLRLECRNLSRLHRPSEIEAEAKESDEIKYFVEEDNYLDITQEVKESVIVNLPMKPLCKPDCRGICPVCGKNRNYEDCSCQKEDIDPRLAILKNWQP